MLIKGWALALCSRNEGEEAKNLGVDEEPTDLNEDSRSANQRAVLIAAAKVGDEGNQGYDEEDIPSELLDPVKVCLELQLLVRSLRSDFLREGMDDILHV